MKKMLLLVVLAALMAAACAPAGGASAPAEQAPPAAPPAAPLEGEGYYPDSEEHVPDPYGPSINTQKIVRMFGGQWYPEGYPDITPCRRPKYLMAMTPADQRGGPKYWTVWFGRQNGDLNSLTFEAIDNTESLANFIYQKEAGCYWVLLAQGNPDIGLIRKGKESGESSFGTVRVVGHFYIPELKK